MSKNTDVYCPKIADGYYRVDAKGKVAANLWWGQEDDYYCFNAGNCFRTKEEITYEDKVRILNEMIGKYDKCVLEISKENDYD